MKEKIGISLKVCYATKCVKLQVASWDIGKEKILARCGYDCPNGNRRAQNCLIPPECKYKNLHLIEGAKLKCHANYFLFINSDSTKIQEVPPKCQK